MARASGSLGDLRAYAFYGLGMVLFAEGALGRAKEQFQHFWTYGCSIMRAGWQQRVGWAWRK
jgi:hypothetical protein